jgi:predicted nucleic-acid-binding protein
MKRAFVDTNVFMRFFTEDDPDKAARSAELFRRAERGELRLIVPEIVVAEIVWVLGSYYDVPREEIGPLLGSLLSMPGFEIQGRDVLKRAVDVYMSTNMDFIDACVMARMADQGVVDIYSFYRKHLDRVPGVTRLEP